MVRRPAALLAATCLGLFAAGCGNDGAGTSGSSANLPTGATGATGSTAKGGATGGPSQKVGIARGTRITTGPTDYGTILQDSRGRTIYLFTKEKSSKAECYGDCARAWPPVLTKSKPVAGKRVDASKLGTTSRENGKQQVTYSGHPLYYYVGEDEPGEVLCQAVVEFGGTWYIVDRAGSAITATL